MSKFPSRNNWNTSARSFSPSESPIPLKPGHGHRGGGLAKTTARTARSAPAPGTRWPYSALSYRVSPGRHQRTAQGREQLSWREQKSTN